MARSKDLFWVIIRKRDQMVMPMPQRRANGAINAFTHVEFEDDNVPRLFAREISARCALTQWLRGKQDAAGHGSPKVVVRGGDLGRKRENYEVTLARLTLL